MCGNQLSWFLTSLFKCIIEWYEITRVFSPLSIQNKQWWWVSFASSAVVNWKLIWSRLETEEIQYNCKND